MKITTDSKSCHDGFEAAVETLIDLNYTKIVARGKGIMS